MHLLSSADQLPLVATPDKRWKRALEAALNLPTSRLNVMRSIGDSLTYALLEPSALWNDQIGDERAWLASRRYFNIITAASLPVHVSIALTRDLSVLRAYSDLDDREWFGSLADSEACADSRGAEPRIQGNRAGSARAVPESDGIASPARTVCLNPGEVLFVEPTEAFRILGDTTFGLIRLTVEARGFHNK